LLSAFMSTISTHLNWGSSYVVNDLYVRFIKPEATGREQVNVGRLSILVLMAVSGALALLLESAIQAFNILLQVGAGTGLIFILRWFWWRINAYTEIAGMIISFVVAVSIQVIDPLWSDATRLVVSVAITTAGWLIVTMVTPPTDKSTLRRYFMKIRPYGKGWQRILDRSSEVFPKPEHNMGADIMMMVVGTFTVYAMLFGVGYFIFSSRTIGLALGGLAFTGILLLLGIWKNAYGPIRKGR
jgi:solute:Na+ symporter, SSS family